jgi:nucleoside-diphosphate-sugar epimerase
MRVLVTGGAGFMGLHVVRALVQSRHEVVSFSLVGAPGPAALDFIGPAPVEWVAGDIRDVDALEQALAATDIDAVVHLAAVTSIGASERDALRAAAEVNVGGVAAVIDAARRRRIARLLHISSAVVYGATDPAVPLDEDAAWTATQIDAYAITKWAGERLFFRALELYGLTGGAVRISAPFGPMENPSESRQVMSPIWSWCRHALAGEPIEIAADLVRDFTYAEDAAAGIAQAFEVGIPGRVYNIASGHNHRFSDVLRTLVSLVEGTAFHIGGKAGAESHFAAQLRGPLSIERARRELDFAPRYDLRRGLAAYLAWLREHPF